MSKFHRITEDNEYYFSSIYPNRLKYFENNNRALKDEYTKVTTLKALIFDVDGTLADTEEVHRLAFNETFRRFGLEWHWSPELYMRLLSISGGRIRIRKFMDEHPTTPPTGEDLDSYAAKIHRDKTERYARMLVDGHVQLRPGVLRLINEAREQGLRLGIATSTALSNVKILLDNNLPSDWESWFEVIATCEQIKKQKPLPAVYNHILWKMGISPNDVVAFEDTENGNCAAISAGIKTIITTHYFTEHHDFRAASLVLDGLGEPGQPFKLSKGNANNSTFVDVNLCRQIVGELAQVIPLKKHSSSK